METAVPKLRRLGWLWAGVPILAKDLRLASRKGWLYALRGLYVAVLGIFTALVWASWTKGLSGGAAVSRAADAGKHIIDSIVWFQFLVVQGVTIMLLAGSVGGEIRRRTFPILLSTPLGILRIVVEKLSCGLLSVGVLLACCLPLLSIVRVFGGVPWGFVLSSLAVTATACLFAGAVAVYFSIRTSNPFAAALMTLLAVGAYHAVGWTRYPVALVVVDLWLLKGVFRPSPAINQYDTPLLTSVLVSTLRGMGMIVLVLVIALGLYWWGCALSPSYAMAMSSENMMTPGSLPSPELALGVHCALMIFVSLGVIRRCERRLALVARSTIWGLDEMPMWTPMVDPDQAVRAMRRMTAPVRSLGTPAPADPFWNEGRQRLLHGETGTGETGTGSLSAVQESVPVPISPVPVPVYPAKSVPFPISSRSDSRAENGDRHRFLDSENGVSPRSRPRFLPSWQPAAVTERLGSPILWKDTQRIFPRNESSRFFMQVLPITAIVLVYTFSLWAGAGREIEWHAVMVSIYVSAGAVLAGLFAPLAISVERQARTWPILLTTPLSDRHLLWAKCASVFYRCLPVWGLLALHLGLSVVMLQIHPLAALGVVFLVGWVHLFLCGTGFWLGSRLPGTSLPVVANFGVAVILWIIVPVIGPLAGDALRGGGDDRDSYGASLHALRYMTPTIQASALIHTWPGYLCADKGSGAYIVWSQEDLQIHLAVLAATSQQRAVVHVAASLAVYAAPGLILMWLASRRLRRNAFA